MIKKYICCLVLLVFFACNGDKKESSEGNAVTGKTLFDLKNNADLGIDFANNLAYTNGFNVYKYRNFYNGGGVSLGDINNDGLLDIYFTSNLEANRLFLNKGNWKFEDITEKSGAKGTRAWSTGVTMVDINADGFMDIYVCNSGDIKGSNKENELFINNGDLTFTEKAAEYGLNDPGFSTHASFFDYDRDGDLDVYLLNNSFQAIGSFNLKKNERPKRDALGGDKLLQNQNGKFVDVSEKAGIYGSVIGFGLGVTVGDVNNDDWPDIFVSNDFFERDYLYLNQKNGTFKEDLEAEMLSISGASMGADMGDLNNDGYNDIFVTEMLPSDYERLKTVTTFEDWNRYEYVVGSGYHHQYTRNTLQANNGNNTFSEISRFAGVEASDWSWGALFFDMDNDGKKDLYIANGIFKDLTNLDYLQYAGSEEVISAILRGDSVDYNKLIDIIPSNKVENHAYKNLGDFKFEKFEQSGLWQKSFSNGSAYGDLDNDGDLDLVVNNVNMPCFIYENKENEQIGHHFLNLKLKGEGANTNAIGSKIIVSAGDQRWMQEVQPTRGFESSCDVRLNFGLGKMTEVDVEVVWPDGKSSLHPKIKADQFLEIKQADAQRNPHQIALKTNIFKAIDSPIKYLHKESKYSDFNRERLIYQMMSTQGPHVAKGDLNGDGLEDVLIPGPKGQPSTLFFQQKNGGFLAKEIKEKLLISQSPEFSDCMFFDADQDGDLDIYLASGGVEISEFSDLLNDKIFLNDGKGNFALSPNILPFGAAKISTGAVSHADIDGDGDEDVFVGERVKIGKYGAACSGFIFVNDGKGKFIDKTAEICPDLKDIGMVTDAQFSDLNKDGKPDLIVIGEFMQIQIFENSNGHFTKKTSETSPSGWWNRLELADVDGDGDQDLIVANHGLNSRFRASIDAPLCLYYNDFDKNGQAEPIITQHHVDGKDYPFALRHDLVSQMPSLKKKFPDFKSFKNASMEDVFSKEQLDGCNVSRVTEMQSGVYINKGNFDFEFRALPSEAQYTSQYAILPTDIDGDGDQDLLLGGNLYRVKPEIGRFDASYGNVLINDGKGNFTDKSKAYGLSIPGQVRDILKLGNQIYYFRNDDSVLALEINN